MAKHSEWLVRALETNKTQTFEFQSAVGGENREFEARVAVSGCDELLAIVRDVSEQKALERQLLEISEREQRRIGHDLHDGLGQYLAGGQRYVTVTAE